MNINSIKLTVLFEDPFWIGILERTDKQGYAVAKTIFGSEPTEVEVYQFISGKKVHFSPHSIYQEWGNPPGNFTGSSRGKHYTIRYIALYSSGIKRSCNRRFTVKGMLILVL